MGNKAYQRGYQKAKFYNKGGAAYYQEGSEVSAADQITADRGNVEQIQVAFATDYNGNEWGFNPSPDNAPPPDLAEFIPEGGAPRQGDLIHSNDTYLYVLGGPELHENIKVGWYKSTGPAGTPPPAEG